MFQCSFVNLCLLLSLISLFSLCFIDAKTWPTQWVVKQKRKMAAYHDHMIPLFPFSGGAQASMVYTLLSGRMVKTLFPCFPKDWDKP